MKTKEEITIRLNELREAYKKTPSKILEIRGKLLKIALARIEKERTMLF